MEHHKLWPKSESYIWGNSVEMFFHSFFLIVIGNGQTFSLNLEF